MHIVMVGDYQMPGDDPRGGIQHVMHNLRGALARRLRVTLVVPQARETARYMDSAGEIIYVARPRLPATLVYWNLISRRVGHEIAKLEPDIVHIQGAAGLTLAWPKLAWPVVFTQHGLSHKDIILGGPGRLRKSTAPGRAMLARQIERLGRKRADEVILINEYVLEMLPDLRNRPGHSIPNPVSDIFMRNISLQRSAHGKLKFVHIGGIWPRKNTLGAIALIHAFQALGRPASLDIIGPSMDRGYQEACRRAAIGLKLADSIRFHGEVKATEVVHQLDRADMLLITSLAEVAPVTVAEAMCRGVPVGAVPAFGLRYMIEEGVNGVFLDAADDIANARKLASFLDMYPDRACIAQEARRKYNVDTIAERTIEVYRRALLRRR